MLTSNPFFIHLKLNELIDRARQEHVSNLVFERQKTLDVMKALVKCQSKIIDEPEFSVKSNLQLHHLKSIGGSFESFYQNMEKITELQKEKEGILARFKI